MMKQITTKDPILRKKAIIERNFDMIKERPDYVRFLTVMTLQPGVMANTKDFSKSAYKN